MEGESGRCYARQTMVQAGLPSRDEGNEGRSGPSPSGHGEVGGYVLAGLLIFGSLGLWLDHQLGVSFLTPLGLVLGVVLGSYLVYLRVLRVPGGPAVDTQGGSGTRMARDGDSR